MAPVLSPQSILLPRATYDLRYSLGEKYQFYQRDRYTVEISKMRLSGKGINLRRGLAG